MDAAFRPSGYANTPRHLNEDSSLERAGRTEKTQSVPAQSFVASEQAKVGALSKNLGDFSITAPQAVSPSSRKPDTTPLGKYFFEECQALVYRYLHKPNSSNKYSKSAIYRPIHGAQHLSRTAVWIPVLLQWRKNAGENDALTFPEEELPALMKAALLHDAGRDGEGEDLPEWEQRSGEYCEDHLLNIGVDPVLAAKCRTAIIEKNKTEKKGIKRTTLFEKLLHDADCLEIMRCCGQFDISKLDLYQDYRHSPEQLKKLVELVKLVRDEIGRQSDRMAPCSVANLETKELLETAQAPTLSEQGKLPYEFAGNALLCQLNALKDHSPELYQLYCAGAGEPPSLTSDHNTLKALSEQAVKQGQPQLTHPVTGKTYDIHRQLPAGVARHRVLMTRLTSLLGMKTPAHEWIASGNDSSVLLKEETESTMESIASFKGTQLPPELKADLFVMASVLGLWNLPEAVGVDQNGSLQLNDVSVCGQFNGESMKTDSGFGATPFELEWLRDPETIRTAFPEMSDQMRQWFAETAPVFKSLTDDDIARAITRLSQKVEASSDQIERLIECYGPEKDMNRSWFRRHFYSRLAYLHRRYPESAFSAIAPGSCSGTLQMQPMEQKAVDASGCAGYCLPVSYLEIDKGELRLYQCMDENNQPVTEAWLRLTPEATRRLAQYQLGIPAPWHRRFEMLSYYFDQVFRSKPVMTPGVRAELIELEKQCNRWLDDLQWDYSPDSKEVGATRQNLINAIQWLRKARQIPGNARIVVPWTSIEFISPSAGLSETKPAASPGQKEVNTDYRLRHFRHGRAWETGLTRKISGEGNITYTGENPVVFPTPVYCHKLPITRNSAVGASHNLRCELFADDMPEAFSFSGIMRLRVDGQNQEASQNLINALTDSGIQVTRASNQETQAHYLKELAFSQNLDIELNLLSTPAQREKMVLSSLKQTKPLFWYDHCRVINGKPVYYRTPQADDGQFEQQRVRAIHNLNNCEETTPKKQLASASKLLNIMHSGSSVDSYVERVRKGIDRSDFRWRSLDIKTGAAAKAMYNVNVDDGSFSESCALLVYKPRVVRRTDAVQYNECTCGNSKPEVVRHKRLSPGCLPTDKTNETTVNGLNFEEIAAIELPNLKRFYGFSEFYSQIDAWADGQSVAEVMPAASLEEQHQSLVREYKNNIAFSDLVQAAGIEQFEQLKKQNPELIDGKISNLEGIKFSNWTFTNAYFMATFLNETALKGAVFYNCKFNQCDFKFCDLSICDLESCTFTSCLFRRARVRPKQVAENTLCKLQSDGGEVIALSYDNYLKDAGVPVGDRLLLACTKGVVNYLPFTNDALEVIVNNLTKSQVETLRNDYSWKFSKVKKIVEAWDYNELKKSVSMPDRSLRDKYQLLTSDMVNLRHPGISHLIKAVGVEQLGHLIAQNPDLADGEIASLEGITINNKSINNIHFKNTLFKGATIANSRFYRCNFDNVDLTQCKLENSDFYGCNFHQINISPEQIYTSLYNDSFSICRDGKEFAVRYDNYLTESGKSHRERILLALKNRFIMHLEFTPEALYSFCKNTTPESPEWQGENKEYLLDMMIRSGLPDNTPEFLLTLVKERLEFQFGWASVLIKPLAVTEIKKLLANTPEIGKDMRVGPCCSPKPAIKGVHYKPGSNITMPDAEHDFDRLKIFRADLPQTTLKGDFSHTDFTGSRMEQTCFKQCNLEHATLSWEQIKASTFAGYSPENRDMLRPVLAKAEDYLLNNTNDPLEVRQKLITEMGLWDFFSDIHSAAAISPSPKRHCYRLS